MKTVICPTDASPMAQNAVRYVKNFSGSMRPSLVLLERAAIGQLFTAAQLYSEEYYFKAANAWTSLNETPGAAAMLSEPSVRLQAIHNIARTAISSQADLIATGVEKSFTYYDSIAQPLAELVKHAKCPALLIPENVSYQPIQRILLVIDHEFTIMSRMHLIADIARIFDAEIFLFQLNKPCNLMETNGFYQCSVDFYFTFPYRRIHFNETETDNIPATIHKLVKQTQADLLITVPGEEVCGPESSLGHLSQVPAAAPLAIPLLAIDTQPRQPVETTGYPFQ
jgi:hypothetical protein